jgi:mono/diheme cytochrome c family protein
MRGKWIVVIIALGLLGFALAGWVEIRQGFSARGNPTTVEVLVGRRMRSMAMPGEAKNLKNPFSATPELLADARHHFADHCASCHGNDGSGNTQIGRNLYPKAPDMRLAATQNLSDGALYYIIHNGIRLTGMPAWGEEHGKDEDSWKLVLFIRHLPKLTPEEEEDMEQYNPRTAADRAEEQQEEEFLKGGNQNPAEHPHEGETK